MVGDQMFSRLEYVHSKNFLHRDLKPENIVMGGKHDADKCYLIDFGLSKQYIDPSTNCHIPNKTGKRLTGTARYASIDTHRGFQQGRKDDLESLVYVLIGFLRGKLPWQGLEWSLLNRKKQKRYSKVGAMKQQVSAEDLCKGLPVQFSSLLTYCKSLKFDQKPNYNYCRRLLREAFDVQGYTFDYAYDWKVGRGATQPSPQTKHPSMVATQTTFGHLPMVPVPYMQHGQFFRQPIMGF
jgi:serine/threonine protein kinase